MPENFDLQRSSQPDRTVGSNNCPNCYMILDRDADRVLTTHSLICDHLWHQLVARPLSSPLIKAKKPE